MDGFDSGTATDGGDEPISRVKTRIKQLIPAAGHVAVVAEISRDDGETKLRKVQIDFIALMATIKKFYESEEDADDDCYIYKDITDGVMAMRFEGGKLTPVGQDGSLAGIMREGDDIDDCIGNLNKELAAHLPRNRRRKKP